MENLQIGDFINTNINEEKFFRVIWIGEESCVGVHSWCGEQEFTFGEILDVQLESEVFGKDI